MNQHDRADALRRAFDESFARAPDDRLDAEVGLLSIRVGAEHYAVRSQDVVTVGRDRRPTRLPGAPTQLLGLVGTARGPLPLYDLAALLVHPRATEPRWMLVVDGGAFGLAFGEFDGQLRLPAGAIIAVPQGGPERHVEAIVRTVEPALPILRMSSIIAAVRQWARRTPEKEK